MKGMYYLKEETITSKCAHKEERISGTIERVYKLRHNTYITKWKHTKERISAVEQRIMAILRTNYRNRRKKCNGDDEVLRFVELWLNPRGKPNDVSLR